MVGAFESTARFACFLSFDIPLYIFLSDSLSRRIYRCVPFHLTIVNTVVLLLGSKGEVFQERYQSCAITGACDPVAFEKRRNETFRWSINFFQKLLPESVESLVESLVVLNNIFRFSLVRSRCETSAYVTLKFI